jgi:peptide/nickel transport system substrate-binding protein
VDVYVQPNANQVQQIRANPSVEFVEFPFRQWVYFAFNTRRPLFQDARVRRAIAMATVREMIVDALLYGHAEVGRGTTTPGDWMHDRNDPQQFIPYDTAQARQLLEEAGWRKGPDGILRNAEGTEFRFTAITNLGNDIRRDILEIMQARLRPLGIVLQPRLVEWVTMVNMLQDTRRNYDAVVSSWVGFFRRDDREILHSANLDRPQQYVGYSNPRLDSLLDTLAVTLDRERAEPMWREYQRLIVQEAPYIVIYYPNGLMGYNRRLRNVVMDTRSSIVNVAEWWIHPDDRRPGETVQ